MSLPMMTMMIPPEIDLPIDFQVDLKAGPAGGAVGSTTGYGEDRFRFEGGLVRGPLDASPE